MLQLRNTLSQNNLLDLPRRRFLETPEFQFSTPTQDIVAGKTHWQIIDNFYPLRAGEARKPRSRMLLQFSFERMVPIMPFGFGLVA